MVVSPLRQALCYIGIANLTASGEHFIRVFFTTTIKIAQARHSKGITLRQLELETSISRTKLNRFERGEGLPNIDEICEIAHALKVSVTDLYEYHYIEKNPQSG